MNDVLFRLSQALSDPENHRSFYFRHRHILEFKVKKYLEKSPLAPKAAFELAQILSKFAPLLPEDLASPKLAAQLRTWKSYPQDRRFYEMLLKQHELLKRFKTLTIRDFLLSHEMKQWAKARARLIRKPLFELDRPYKPTKSKALKHLTSVRALLRREPLLRWKDLQLLRVSNAQKIIEGFPFIEHYRKKKLLKLNLSA